MTDFIDVLEHQLIDAHPRARRRLPLPLPTWRRGAVVLAAAAAVAAIVAVVVALASPSEHRTGGQQTAPPPPTTTTAPQTAPPTGPKVAVLNGTLVAGLGHVAADKLENNGFAVNVVATHRPAVTRTTIFFADGSYADATAVAQCLGIDRMVALRGRIAREARGDKVVLLIGADHPG
jgi:hypothetical protein